MKKLRNIVLTLLSLSIPVYAVVTILPDGTTETATVTVADPGDVLIVEEGGAITVAGAVGVLMNAANQTVLNQGSITTSGASNFHGIRNVGVNGMIVNSGLISTAGGTASGIQNDGVNGIITSSGQISTIGNLSRGIFNNGASSIITSSGFISTGGLGAAGILNNGASSVVTSSGFISTGGIGADGIRNFGDNGMITNSGTIETQGSGARGIANSGAGTMITNSGLISTTGDRNGAVEASGIFTDDDFSVITNSGTISTTGSDAYGIQNDGGVSLIITNSGRILTTAASVGAVSSHGILNTGASAMITNSGLISTTGDLSNGITNSGNNVVMINSGQISAIAAGSSGIGTSGANDHIINSGTIRSAQASALAMSGTAPMLSLLRGSNLQGSVSVVNPLTLNVETGLNLALTLSAGNTFSSFGITAPFAVLGETVAVIDPTGLALQADVVADLSDTILDGIYRRRASLVCPCIAYGSGAWVQGLGSYRKRGREKRAVGYDNWQGGFLIGYDTICGGGSIGLFGGASYGAAEVDQQTQTADFTTYVGGLTYEYLFCNAFFGCALAVGQVNWDNERSVMNNLAQGGVDIAKTEADGLFASPEATLAYRFYTLWCQPIVTFTMRYASLFLEDYAEQGSLTNLAVQDRHIDLLTGRLELALPLTSSCGACCLSIEPYVGVYRRSQISGRRVWGDLLGQPLNFNPGSPSTLNALLIGMRSVQSLDTFNLFVNFEASFDDHSSSRILGEAGLGFSY